MPDPTPAGTGPGEPSEAQLRVYEVLRQYATIRSGFDRAGLMNIARRCLVAAAPVAADARPEAGDRAWPVVRDILVRHRETWNHGRGDSLLGPMMVNELDRILTEVRAATPPGGGTREPEEPNPLDVLALARVAARRHGYALTVHGSLSRDLDLVAVPWIADPTDPAVLVEAIRKAVGGMILVADDNPDKGREGYYGIDDASKHSPVERPHGRLAWSIYGVLGGSYIDLSVMPPRAALRRRRAGDGTP